MQIGNLDVYGVIYKIKNKINNKVYIGQTVQGFDRRYKNNIVDYSKNNHLISSIGKYGIKNFEIIKILDVAFSKIELDIKEISWIAIYKSNDENYGYNKTIGGSGVVLSEETKKKLGKLSKERWKNPEYRDNLSAKLKEITSTEEYRNNMSKTILSSEKHRLAMASNEFKLAQSNSKKELWCSEVYRKKVIDSIKKSWDEDRKARASIHMKERHKNKEYKKNMALQFKKRWENPEENNKLRKAMMKKFYMINIITKEVYEFLGRKALADYINKSESYVKKYMSKKLLHDNKYLFSRTSNYEEAL